MPAVCQASYLSAHGRVQDAKGKRSRSKGSTKKSKKSA